MFDDALLGDRAVGVFVVLLQLHRFGWRRCAGLVSIAIAEIVLAKIFERVVARTGFRDPFQFVGPHFTGQSQAVVANGGDRIGWISQANWFALSTQSAV